MDEQREHCELVFPIYPTVEDPRLNYCFIDQEPYFTIKIVNKGFPIDTSKIIAMNIEISYLPGIQDDPAVIAGTEPICRVTITQTGQASVPMTPLWVRNESNVLQKYVYHYLPKFRYPMVDCPVVCLEFSSNFYYRIDRKLWRIISDNSCLKVTVSN